MSEKYMTPHDDALAVLDETLERVSALESCLRDLAARMASSSHPESRQWLALLEKALEGGKKEAQA